MTYKLSFPKTITITDMDIDDIMCTALEGGITYWCNSVDVLGKYLGEYAHEQISRGGILVLRKSETGECYTLTKEKFLKGLETACKENIYSEYDWIQKSQIDTSQIDADVADAIVQIALFGDIIFG